MSKEKTPKKIIFSEEVDSRIDGLAVGLSFVAVGLFLIFVPDFFGNEIVGQVVRWIFIIWGVLGLCTEIGKIPPILDIKGLDDLWIGIIFLGGWLAILHFLNHWIWSIIGIFCLIFGTYSTFHGMFLIGYSIFLIKKDNQFKKGSIMSDVVIFLTKVSTSALVVIQLITAILALL